MTETEKLESTELEVAKLKGEVRQVLKTVRNAVLDMESTEMEALFVRADKIMESPLYQ